MHVVQLGFAIWGVHFDRSIREIDAFDDQGNPYKRSVDVIINYSLLKHMAPSGKRYHGANDNYLEAA